MKWIRVNAGDGQSIGSSSLFTHGATHVLLHMWVSAIGMVIHQMLLSAVNHSSVTVSLCNA